MRFTKRISLLLGQTTKISGSLLRNPPLCRSYIVGPVSTTSPAFFISSYSRAGVTGLPYPIRRRFIGHTAEQFSDDEYECEFEERKITRIKMATLGVSEDHNNKLSHNQSLIRAIICSGLFPGVASVVHRETSMSFKTMDDGQVSLYANSVNSRFPTIPYPWLVFGVKVKVNAVLIRDSTGVPDSSLIIFGGALSSGVQVVGHLKMLDGYIDFFMDPNLADSYVKLKDELDKLLQKKLEDPSMDIHKEGKYLMLSVQEIVAGDQCEGRFVFGRDTKRPSQPQIGENKLSKDGTNPKSLLQTLLMRAGHAPPKYKTKHFKTNEFRALVEFKGMQFVGKPQRNKTLAEKDAAVEALAWLTHTSDKSSGQH